MTKIRYTKLSLKAKTKTSVDITAKNFKTLAMKQKIKHHLFHNPVHPVLTALACSLLVAALFGTIFVALSTNLNTTAKDSTLCSSDLGAKSYNEQAYIINQLKDKISFDITIADETHSIALRDLNITIDHQKTIDNALSIKNPNSFFANLNPNPICNIGLAIDYDQETLLASLQEIFETTLQGDLEEPSIIFANDRYSIKPGEQAYSLDLSPLLTSLDQLTNLPATRALTLELSTTPYQILEQNAETTTKILNHLLEQKYTVNLGTKAYYTLTKSDLATIISATPSLATSSFNISYNEQALTDIINNKIVRPLSSTYRDAEIIKINDSQIITITKGQSGKTVTNGASITNKLFSAIKSHTSATVTAEQSIKNYETKERSLTGERWVDLDLTKRSVTLYVGDTPMQTFTRIAVGARSTPTITGVYTVWNKTALQDMSGVNPDGSRWRYPNVHWVVYWERRGYAFHEAWWMQPHNYGTGLSHGCVNMLKDEAKILYDFVSIGTVVVSHY